MTSALPNASLAALRQTAEAAPRLATTGLSSPGDVAGQFAAMLAGLRDQGGATEGTGTQPAAAGGLTVQQNAGEHRVGGAAVTLLVANDTGETAAAGDTLTGIASRRARDAAEDVSGQVVQTAVAAGLPSDGRWMAMLLATELSAS